MSPHQNKALLQRSAYLPLTGSVIESDPTPTATSLAQNSAVVDSSDLGVTPPPLVGSSVPENTSTAAAAQSSTPTANADSSSSGHQIPLSTVVGACVAAFIALLLAVLLALYCSRRQKHSVGYSKSRNLANNFSRGRSHLGPWKRMDDDDDDDRTERRERPMGERPPSGPLGTMFRRPLSNASGEKSSETHNRESVGTMQNFAKYHPGLAAEMASQGDGGVAKPPPVHLVGRSSDLVASSWDGDTATARSPTSLHSGLSSFQSPLMMATAKATPPATISSLHHWESAEVVHIGSDFSDTEELRNPFEDSPRSIKTKSLKVQNPFFSAQDHHVQRTILPDTHKNPFADSHSPHDSSTAIQSLIAALEEPLGRGGNDKILSVQSSLYSRATADDGDSAISVTAFPYPPI